MSVKSYLELWGKRVNFGIIIAEIQQKVWERRRKRGERKCWILVMWIPKFFYPIPADQVWSVRGVPKVKRKKKLWQTNCGNAIAEIGKKKFVTIVAMTLPKMGEKNVVPKSREE